MKLIKKERKTRNFKMVTLLVSFSVTLLSGCLAYREPYFEPALKKVKDLCVEYKGERCENVDFISIYFGEYPPQEEGKETLGTCGPNGITINSLIWYKLTDIQQEMVIIHEVGHCAWGKGHDDRLDPETGLHMSIMHPIIMQDDDYLANEEYYLEEFFSEVDKDYDMVKRTEVIE